MRGGWREEVWTTSRANASTGFKVVHTVRVRLHAPPLPGGEGNKKEAKDQQSAADTAADEEEDTVRTPHDNNENQLWAESEHEEWLGDDGTTPRRRTLKVMPRRFALAHKTYGGTPFSSPQKRTAAVEEFGAFAVTAKRIFGGLGSWSLSKNR